MRPYALRPLRIGLASFKLILGAMIAGCFVFLIGFFLFMSSIDWVEPTRIGEADGAVVLTGGADRISDAINLVAKGHAARLLITGVNQGISSTEIARLTPEFQEYFDCCIDLGYRAQNTAGNALEARQWAQARAMHSLIVVTSNYHMPRALLEMRAALPNIELVRYSVVLDQAKSGSWLRDPQLVKAFAVEYLKFLRAWARLKMFPPPVTDDPRVQSASASGPWPRQIR